MKYWLFKTEPSTFSWDDFKKSPGRRCEWEGVRNYQARNFFKDMKKGDGVLFYHSVVKPQIICGTAEIVREAYPDHHQFDASSKYFDPKSDPDNPRWLMVDIKYKQEFKPPIERQELLEISALKSMALLQKGSRLSIQPVTAAQWRTILKLR